MFFGRKNTGADDIKKEVEEAAKAAEQAKEEQKESAADDTAASAKDSEKDTEKPADKKADTSSSESSSDEKPLSGDDVKKIKELFKEQEVEIESMKKVIDDYMKQIARSDKEMKAFRIDYTKQVRENEATVIRYRKMIEDEKSFAITKFAKDLLDVRDAIRMALENTDIEAAKNEEDLTVLKEKFLANVEGQTLTADVMDNVLRRF